MDRYDFRTQRLFVEEDLRGGQMLEMDRARSNYLLNVLRLRDGGQVLLFNGRDGEWLAIVRPDGRKSCRLEPEKQVRAQTPAYDLQYLFAPLKQARLDYMIQKAVEMGVAKLQPVLTQHTQVHKLNHERMAANAVEAAEQCGILNIPQIGEPVKLDALLDQWDTGRRIIFCDEATSNDRPIDVLQSVPSGPLAVLIGPEGGFSADERAQLRACDYVTSLPLGPRILRADTAAVAALALVQAVLGDWNR